MTKELKTQWHPAFCSAVKLELIENKADLDYTNEYNLNSKPIQIDLLVIKKSKDVEIKNEIGKIFRGHNIMEYKSPKDAMNIDTFVKAVAYACLYKANEEHVEDICLEDITITLIREQKPRELLKWFIENGYAVYQKYRGIFYVEKEGVFPIQVIASGELTADNQKWLTLLSSNLSRTDAERIIVQMGALVQKDEKEFGDSVLQVAMKENQKLFDDMKMEDPQMCDALRELMKPELDEALEKGRELEKTELIFKALKNNRTVEEIAEFFEMPLDEVKAVERTWLKEV